MYKELTERVDKLDTSVADIKSMLQQLLQAQKAPPTAATSTTSAPSSPELWSPFQPMLHQQRQYADQQHEVQIQKIRNLMEARFKDTQADIKAIKAHLLQTTGTAPPTIIFVDKAPDDAKKGEKVKKKKGYEDGLYIAPDSKSSLVAEIPRPDGSKKVDVTLNAFADEKARLKKDMETKGKTRFDQEKKVLMEMEEQGTSEPKDEQENPKPKRRQPTRKVRQPKSTPSRITKHTPLPPKSSSHQTSKPTNVETPVVSTIVGTSVVSIDVTPTTAINTTTTTLTQSTTPPKTTSLPPTPPAKKQKTSDDTSSIVMTTVVETPVVSTVVSQPPITQITTTQPTKTPPTSPKPKRRRIILEDDTSPPPTSSQPLTLSTIPNPVPLSSVQALNPKTAIIPTGVQYLLDLPAVREEIKSFYFEDDPTKRNLPSLQGCSTNRGYL
ncbi:hypothetical protein HanIR_Chr17g0886111 [Helianthus annuus]|nr:hypothetical protein HanIR_Chr17g0886111 [Helianthus annuus]